MRAVACLVVTEFQTAFAAFKERGAVSRGAKQ